MSIYRRDEINPEWEPAPWTRDSKIADKQELGFHQRALKAINWVAIPWKAFPDQGILGHTKDWLSSVDAAFYATHDGEDLLLIDNVWFGWPDPPRWSLVSRPCGRNEHAWVRWGHFPDLPPAWVVPNGSA